MSNGPSSPDVVSATFPVEHSTRVSSEAGSRSSIPRSASYTHLPEHGKAKATHEMYSISRSLSENVLSISQGNISRKSATKFGLGGTVKSRKSFRHLGSRKHRSRESDPQLAMSKLTLGEDNPSVVLPYEPETPKDEVVLDKARKTLSVTGSISNFARKSWIANSRSPSPSPGKRKSRKEIHTTPEATCDSSLPKFTQSSSVPVTETKNEKLDGTLNGRASRSPQRRNSDLSRKPKRPLSSILSKAPAFDAPLVPPIPKSFSVDKLPSFKSSTLSNIPPVPKSRSSERLQSMGVESPQKKDELWSTFRALDGEYQKFQSRPSILRPAIVRSALLPFLRTYAVHRSTSSLRPEDLDRRIIILNKWWTALLEMLHGRYGESVSFNDRPVVLEAAAALMMRPEWTLPPLAISIKPQKTPRSSLKSRSTTSLGSTMSDFLADSVYHNVKNTFMQNLLAQMAYVVDKMSGRNIPPSVVTFCGKTTAYAFFYCEGIAEILVRLWATPPDTLRRVLGANGFQRDIKLDSVADQLWVAFPPCTHGLTFKALRSLTRYLRGPPRSPMPIATTYIPWKGPWISRWAGKDTDLFFVFTKCYTDLACGFLPNDPSSEEMMVAPGWVLVQAQILTVLDATMQQINSQSSIEQNTPSSTTFDDILGDADATATVLPLPANGGVRSMAENRLIMLLRDCLSGSTAMTEKARSIFAQSFGILLKAAARVTSMFDHNACFTLCDFLEEAIPIMTRYHQESDASTDTIHWHFWLDVCRRMLQSQNSMTEVRVCSFIYTMWSSIISGEDRKRSVCLDWLLGNHTFYTHFNHWCPMVRAFYMRLLIWRVARLHGSASQIDTTILEALAGRLHEVYRNFLYILEDANRRGVATPSTAFCSPAPGRCLQILRNDSQPSPSGMFLTFDGILSSNSTSKVNPYERHSSRNLISQGNATQLIKGSGEGKEGGKRQWRFFKSVVSTSNSFRDRTKTRSSSPPISRSSSPRRGGPVETSTLHSRPEGSKNFAHDVIEPVPPYRSLSFKFSLEWIDRDNNPAVREGRLGPPKLPLPAQLFLQRGSSQAEIQDNTPRKPEGAAIGPSKYAGRALAEWALLITECQNFFETRKAEGVPSYHLVETPTLGVGPFRKI